MTTWIYLGSVPSEHTRTVQTDACRALVKRYMLDMPQYGALAEATLGADSVLKTILTRLVFGDVVVIPGLQAIGDLPTKVLENVSAITGKGAQLYSVTHDGPVNPIEVHRNSVPWFPLEQRILTVDTELADERQRHREELEAYGKQVQEQMISTLLKRGVNIAGLIALPDDMVAKKVPANPSRARDLKAKRQALGLTQEESGKLVSVFAEKAIAKGQVSQWEGDGAGNEDRLDVYEMALNYETSRRRLAAKQQPDPEPIITDDMTPAAKIKALDHANHAT